MKVLIKKSNLHILMGIVLYIILSVYYSGYIFIVGLSLMTSMAVFLNLERHQRLVVNRRYAIWILFLFGILFANNAGNSHWIRPFIIHLFIYICMMCGHIRKRIDFQYALNVFRGIGIITSISVIVAKIAPQLMFATIYKMFSTDIQTILFQQMQTDSYYSGIFTAPAIAATAICIAVFAIYVQRKKRIMEMILLFIGLVLTGKRSHIIFFVAAIVLYEIIVDKNLNKKFIKFFKILLLGCVAGIGLVLLLEMLPVERLGAIGRIVDAVQTLIKSPSKTVLDYATAGRYSTYLEAWEYFIENPIRGMGWNQFSATNYNKYLGVNLTNVHNIYLQLLCDSGIVGFLGFLIPAMYSLAKSCSYAIAGRENDIIKFAIIYQIFYLLYGFAETAFDSPFLYLTYFISIFVALYGLQEKDYVIENLIRDNTAIEGN